MPSLLQQLPRELFEFILVAVFSLIIGLSQRRLHAQAEGSRLFGTDRTFTFIGILGFILYTIDNHYLTAFMGGGLVLSALLGIFYIFKIRHASDYGLTTILIALITYCLTPLIHTQPLWLFLLIIVTVLIFTELKSSFVVLSRKFNREEFITLGTFLFIAGVVLPMVPDKPIVSEIPLTPYKIWMAVVVISSISYLSYLLQRFVFKGSGILVSGILGGAYSSTATTVILAKKAKENPEQRTAYSSAILLSVAMMFPRILVLLLIFNLDLFRIMLPGLGLLFVLTAGAGIFAWTRSGKVTMHTPGITTTGNPLEFKVALLFALLYIIFYTVTHFTLLYFGKSGLQLLSVVTGVTDIDPFLIGIFQGKLPHLDVYTAARASYLAIMSNNILKTFYAWVFGGTPLLKTSVWLIAVIVAVNALIIILL